MTIPSVADRAEAITTHVARSGGTWSAYSIGRLARVQGVLRASNPNEAQTMPREEWDRGWLFEEQLRWGTGFGTPQKMLRSSR